MTFQFLLKIILMNCLRIGLEVTTKRCSKKHYHVTIIKRSVKVEATDASGGQRQKRQQGWVHTDCSEHRLRNLISSFGVT
mmetsp:Transcript_10001/g.11475  ORF Transcript_10001/g.11475 Transcript_10001/m.11475 type:complete len:80 (-) Transcript_10001:175-414(-)